MRNLSRQSKKVTGESEKVTVVGKSERVKNHSLRYSLRSYLLATIERHNPKDETMLLHFFSKALILLVLLLEVTFKYFKALRNFCKSVEDERHNPKDITLSKS